jgi:chromosome segregation ATPase
VIFENVGVAESATGPASLAHPFAIYDFKTWHEIRQQRRADDGRLVSPPVSGMLDSLPERMAIVEQKIDTLSVSVDARFEEVTAHFVEQREYIDFVGTRVEQKLSARFDGLERAMIDGFDRVDVRFGGMDQRFEEIDERFEQVDKRFDRVEVRLDRVEVRLDRVEARLDRVEARLARVEARLDRVEARLARMERNIALLVAALPRPPQRRRSRGRKKR